MSEAKAPKARPNIAIGQPGMALLNAWGQTLEEAFGQTAYFVGSALLKGKEWNGRDVDVRILLPAAEFERLIGKRTRPNWSHPRFAALCIGISLWGQKVTGLPIDFQFQEQDEANAEFPFARSALGMWLDGEHR